MDRAEPWVAPVRAAVHWRMGWGAVVLAVAVAVTLYRVALVQHSGISLFVDEAYYWTWSREPAWGYFSKPPLIAWLMAAGTALWGDSVLGVKAATMWLYPATAWVVYRMGKALMDERAGALAALVFITSPMVGLLGLAASTDAPLLLCWALAAWALWRAVHDGGWPAWLGLGLAVGLGLLSKYTMAAFVLSALPMLWWRRSQPGLWQGVALTSLVALLCFGPHLAWNLANGAPTLRHTAEITVGASQAGGWPALGEFVASQTLMLGPLATVGLGLAAWQGRRLVAWGGARRTPDLRQRYLLALTLPLLALAAAQACLTRANMNWAAPAFVGAALLLARYICASASPWRWLLAVAASNLLLVGAVVHARDLAGWAGRPLPESADVFVRMRGWNEAFAQLTPVVAAHPDWPLVADGRTLRAHAAYGLRRQGVRLAVAPHAGAPRDQFEIMAQRHPRKDGQVLLLGESPPTASCRHIEPLRQVQVAVGPRRQLVLFLSACTGWQGAGAVP